MSKQKWGIKRVCPSCGIKYYDFNKNPIICPRCEFEFDPDLLLKSRKGRSIATKVEDFKVSNDIVKEEKTMEDDIDALENDQEILEIDDETNIQENVEEDNIEEKISENNSNIDIIDDEIDDKNEFSIEVDDESDVDEEK